MLGTPSRPQTAPAKSARSSEKTTPLTTLEVRRLKRLKEIEHMLKRKDMLRASPSGLYQPWSASGELPRGRRNLLPQQPAPIPPLNPRVVQQELVKARRRASRLGEWETLNRLRTPSGIAAFERRVRADSYGRVQRRVNGIHELPRSGSLHEHLGENLQSIETQTQSEDLQLQQLQEQNEQALEDMAQADLAYLDMVLHKAGMHPTAGARAIPRIAIRAISRGGERISVTTPLLADRTAQIPVPPPRVQAASRRRRRSRRSRRAGSSSSSSASSRRSSTCASRSTR